MPSRRRLIRPLLALLLVALGVGADASLASAAFRGSAAGSTTVGTLVVAPPTQLAVTVSCGKRSVTFSWVASASRSVDGYELHFSANGAVRTMAAKAGTAYPVIAGVTYVYALAATTSSSWHSVDTSKLPPVKC